MRPEDSISNITSESGVIASLVRNPDFIYYSDALKPEHFSDHDNALLYSAIGILAQQGIKSVDAYNIVNALESSDETKRSASSLPVESIQEFLDMADTIARYTLEEYMLLVSNVLDAAFRRETFRRLRDCEKLCMSAEEAELERKIYSAFDDVMMKFSSRKEVPPFSEIVDDCWQEIRERQGAGYAGIPFKFPTLNQYATIERGELFIFAAEAKRGKSIMLLNCAVDLLRQGYSVLYIDSELNSRMFTARILSHITGIEFKRLTAGNYTKEEEERIDAARMWLKDQRFTHIYIPMFDQQTIYTAVKKVMHTSGLDVVIVDYFKGSGEGDAFDSYQELGRFVDCVKNKVAGELNICAIGATQATSTGKVADSAKIGRNASTIAMLLDKTPEEIEADGVECGNKKLTVVLNRNGMQMAPGEYIDLFFDGNRILYEEAKQHIPSSPF